MNRIIEQKPEENVVDNKIMKKEKIRHPKRQGLAKWMLAFSIISTILLVLYNFLIPAGGIFGGFLYIIWFIIVAFTTVFTIGLIWLSEGFKNFSVGFRTFASKVIHGSKDLFLQLKPYFPIFVSILGIFVLLSLIFSIIWFCKPKENETHTKRRMVTSIVFAILFSIALGFAIAITLTVK